MIKHKIELFLLNKRLTPTIDLVQSDSGREIECSFPDYTIPSGATAKLWLIKPSSKIATCDGIISGNIVTIILTEQQVVESGLAVAQLKISNAGKIISSFSIYFNFQEDVSTNGIISTEDVKLIDTFLQEQSKKLDDVIALKTDQIQKNTSDINVLKEDFSKLDTSFNQHVNNHPSGGSGAVTQEQINKAVNDYLSRNPVQSTPVDATLTQSKQAADAKVVGDYLGRMQDGGTIVPPPEPPQPPVEPQPVPSVNLFDKSKAESGRYDASNGQHVAGSDYMTITLPYKHGDVIRKSKDVSWFTTWILLCDSAKNPIISNVNVVPGNNFTNPGWDEWKMPENIYSLEPKYAQAKYIKVGVSIHGTVKDFSQFMVTINNPLPDHYVPPTSGDVSTASATASTPTFVYSATLDEHIKNVASEITGDFDGKTLVFVGDSIVQGLVQEQGASNFGKQHGFVEMLQAKYPKANFKNLAKGGATMANFSGASIPAVVTQVSNAISQYPNADYVIIEGGINDTWATSKIQLGTVSTGYNASLDESTFCGALESILKKAVAQYTGRKIGFVVTHKVPSSPNWVQYSEKIKEICKKWSIPYLDLYNESTLNYALDSVKSGFSYHTSQHPQGDGLHPNEKCYEQIYVPKIESWLRRL